MLKARTKASLLLLTVVVCFAALIYGFLHYYENFHTVIPHRVYRSAELTQSELITHAHENHLMSVLNLRGENKAYRWYQVEATTVKSLNISLYNVRLSSYKMPSKTLLLQLAHILISAPKPMLIHCASGADRSGLASAMVILLHNGTIAEAGKQISWKYGAVRSDSTGKQMLAAYTLWLKLHDIKASSAAIFMTWLRTTNHYEPLQHHR